ncbi:hypothetical protein PL11_001480 [Lentilactobacillus curieae]|uniref:YxeA family protein n=1 Tax=Lentilactobacillus curieae TaxID=1138822 RepID=A0A1S6QGD8_9LACO|nr:YxeA family protein [Lentilactobacillus curieae]AQW20677.1 hypothetical protein PL11_001480 [Lentilactobacillus curieae]
MKKRNLIISTIVAVIAFVAVFATGYGWYLRNYGGQDYYTQITTKGQRMGKNDNRYKYHQAAYNQDGKKKIVEFNSGVVKRPLKMNAYLKLSYNESRGQVITWNQVSKTDIPAKAMDKLK